MFNNIGSSASKEIRVLLAFAVAVLAGYRCYWSYISKAKEVIP